MMHMCCCIRAYEEGVMIYIIAATINVSEKCDVLLLALLFHV